MPVSFICACVKFVIRRSSQSATSLKGPDNRHGEDATLAVLMETSDSQIDQ